MKKDNLKGTLILMISAMVWGASFVSQSAGRDLLGSNTFNGLRMLLGALTLLPFSIFITFKSKQTPEYYKKLIKSGVLCGIVLCIASTVQTYGIAYTTAGKSGFITAMYILFVPIIGIFFKKPITVRIVLCALIAMVGMYMLTMTGDNKSINKGELLTLVCAVFFAVHIILTDNFADGVNPIQFSFVQFLTCGIINTVLMFIFEQPSIEAIKLSGGAILYSGMCSCGIAYTLQPLGQKYAEPATASIVMSLESVFSMLFGALLQGTAPTLIEGIGCVVMFAAIVISQLHEKKNAVRIQQ